MKSRLHFVVAPLIVLIGCAYGSQATLFEPLFRITSVKGKVMVVRSGSDTPEQALEAHAYPYGSRLLVPRWNPKTKSPAPEVSFSLSRDHRFRLSGEADLKVGDGQHGDLTNQVFVLKSGTLKTFISVSTVKTGGAEDAAVESGIQALSIETPLAVCTRLTERNEVSVFSKGGPHTMTIVSESGTMEVEGPQFKISSMRRNAEIEIFGDQDYTRILSLVADFTLELEKGVDGVEKTVFRPRSVAKIWRSYAEIGGKQAVSVMVAFPDGSINSYAYMVGEKAVVDSTFVSSEKPIAEEGTIVFPGNGADAFNASAFPDMEISGSTDAVKVQGNTTEENDSGGYNFDAW